MTHPLNSPLPSGVSLSLKTTSTRSTRATVGTLGGQGLEEDEGQQRLREIVPLDYTEAEKQVQYIALIVYIYQHVVRIYR